MKHTSWFRRLLALFPADFRGEFGSQMEADFDDQRRDVEGRGCGAEAALWARTASGMVRTGAREHASQMLSDARHGARLAGRQPGPTFAAALVLALGIAAVTGGFTVIDAFLLRPLPFADPGSLVHVWSTHAQAGAETVRNSLPDVEAWAGAQSTAGVAAFNYTEEDLTGDGRPQRINAARVSSNVFEVLGVHPLVGRGFARGEDRLGAAPVAVISHGFWTRRLGARPDVLSQTVEINGRRHAVVGVMPELFVFPLPLTEVWLPYVFDPAVYTWDHQAMQAVARLAPGVSADAAEREFDALTRALAAPHGEAGRQRGVRFEPLRNALNFADEGFRIAGPVMLLASCLILFAACANVSSVLLGRALTRSREVAVRSAIGASRLRLFRQFIFESALLAVAALVLGLLLTQWWLWWIQGLLPLELYRVGDIALDPRAAAVASAAAGVSLLLSAGLPAARFGRPDLLSVLRLDGGGSTTSTRTMRLQSGLLITQVTLSVALIASAFVAIDVVRNLSDREPGFDRERVLTMKLILGADRYGDAASLRQFHERAIAEVRALPGVESAAIVNHLPLNHETSTVAYARPGEQVHPTARRPTAIQVSVSQAYFATMGIGFREGRDFDTRDSGTAMSAAIVNRALAARVWGAESPIGQRIELGTGRVPWTVVGVVEDARQRELVGEAEPIVYRPLTQVTSRHARILVRSSGDPLALVDAVQKGIWRVDAALPLTETRTLDQVLFDFLLPQRAMTVSMATMAITGLSVTAIGLYGLLTVIVAQRRREIGVRMALGAGRQRVVRDIVARGVKTTATGLVFGLVLAVFLAKSMEAVLPGARALDPLAIGGTLAVLAAVAFAAAFVPARRATRIDPLAAMRTN